jgi:hypothetical protein
VIYTVTAIGRRGQDTATVVIAVGVGTTTLKVFKETEKIVIARSLVSLFRVFVVFFIFKK